MHGIPQGLMIMLDLSEKRRDHLSYTVLFIVAFVLTYAAFLLEGKTFIWSSAGYADGLNQHYTALVYEGMWLRDIARSVLAGSPTVPLWDPAIGYGSNIITTFSYYSLGDPLNLLSALVPSRHTEYLYCALVVVRLYLAGLGFVSYCHKMHLRGLGPVASALAYVFCGYSLYASVRHPFFINPMVYLPLLLVGVERVYRDRRPGLFILSVFVAAASNFYFFYMLVLCVAVYAACRFFTFRHRHLVRELASWGSWFVLFGIVGVLCAGMLFVPSLTALLGSQRASVALVHDPLYAPNYYLSFVPSLFTPDFFYRWRCLGYSGPALLGVGALCSDRRHRGLLVGLVLCTLLLLVPAGGKALNGFSYPSNRWCFAYSFYVCMMLALEWDSLTSNLETLLPGVFLFVSVTTLACVLMVNHAGSRGASTSLALMVFALITLLAFDAISRPWPLHNLARGHVLLTLIIVGIVLNGNFLYSAYGTNYIKECLSFGRAIETLPGRDYSAIRDLVEPGESGRVEGFVRVESDDMWDSFLDTGEKYGQYNANIFAGLSSTQFYWSLNTPYTGEYLSSLGLPDIKSQAYFNLDQRAYLTSLASVSYEVARNYLPSYGFTPVANTDSIWKNQHALPLGYTYAQAMPASEYKRLDPAHMQQAMMQAVVLDDNVLAGLNDSLLAEDVSFEDVRPEVTFELSGNISDEGNNAYLAQHDAHITLHFDGVENCETYLYVPRMSMEPVSTYRLYLDDNPMLPREGLESLAKNERNRMRWDDFNYTHWSTAEAAILVSGGGVTKRMYYRSPFYDWSMGQSAFLVNLGYHEEPFDTITLTIPASGLYSFGEMQVVCQPMGSLAGYVENLGSSSLVDVWTDTNAFGGNIAVDAERIMVVAMPYDEGWTATVDGSEAEVFRANTMFMGIHLEPGQHEVAFRYTMPILKFALAATLIGLACVPLSMKAFAWSQRRWRNSMSLDEG